MSQPWSAGLFSCFDDCGTCMCVWLCPACMYGQMVQAHKTGQRPSGSCCDCGDCCSCFLLGIWFVGPCLHACTRTEIRRTYDLPEEPCMDILVTIFCIPCAICQEYREIKGRIANSTWKAPVQGGPAVTMER